MQDQRFGAITLSNCSRVDLHGPFEIMYTTDQLDFVQGTIVGINEDQIEYTVQVLKSASLCIHCLLALEDR